MGVFHGNIEAGYCRVSAGIGGRIGDGGGTCREQGAVRQASGLADAAARTVVGGRGLGPAHYGPALVGIVANGDVRGQVGYGRVFRIVDGNGERTGGAVARGIGDLEGIGRYTHRKLRTRSESLGLDYRSARAVVGKGRRRKGDDGPAKAGAGFLNDVGRAVGDDGGFGIVYGHGKAFHGSISAAVRGRIGNGRYPNWEGTAANQACSGGGGLCPVGYRAIIGGRGFGPAHYRIAGSQVIGHAQVRGQIGDLRVLLIGYGYGEAAGGRIGTPVLNGDLYGGDPGFECDAVQAARFGGNGRPAEGVGGRTHPAIVGGGNVPGGSHLGIATQPRRGIDELIGYTAHYGVLGVFYGDVERTALGEARGIGGGPGDRGCSQAEADPVQVGATARCGAAQAIFGSGQLAIIAGHRIPGRAAVHVGTARIGAYRGIGAATQLGRLVVQQGDVERVGVRVPSLVRCGNLYQLNRIVVADGRARYRVLGKGDRTHGRTVIRNGDGSPVVRKQRLAAIGIGVQGLVPLSADRRRNILQGHTQCDTGCTPLGAEGPNGEVGVCGYG